MSVSVKAGVTGGKEGRCGGEKIGGKPVRGTLESCFDGYFNYPSGAPIFSFLLDGQVCLKESKRQREEERRRGRKNSLRFKEAQHFGHKKPGSGPQQTPKLR